MNIIVVGGGKVGSTLIQYLCKENHNIVLIDTNPKIVEHMVNTYDIMGVCGNGASCEVLAEAIVNKTYLIIATTQSDELNILSCMIARKMGARHCIARVRNPDYAKQLVFMRDELRLSMMVNPEFDAANEISRMLRFPAAIKLESFAKGRVDLAEIHVRPHGKLDGLSLYQLYRLFKIKVLICAVQRGDKVYIPSGDFILKAGDKIHLTATHSELNSFFKAIGIVKNRVKNVLIIGGGTIAYYLTRQLSEMGMAVKIIEQDEKRCTFLSEKLPRADIILGDGTDQDVLIEEGIETTDACVALTGIDEENILISMYAKMKQVNKIITKVNRLPLLELMGNLGDESIISPKAITANLILQYCRAKQNSDGSNVKTLYKLVNNQVEALEFIVTKNNRAIEIPLKELPLKKNLLIAAICRGNKTLFPNGDDKIYADDSVIVVTTNQLLRDFDDILDLEPEE